MTEAIQATAEAVAAQLKVDQVLDQGYAVLPSGESVYSHLYFDGLRQLMVGVAALGELPGQAGSFERANISGRLLRLQTAMALAEDWPGRFLGVCSRGKGAYAAFTKDADEIPYWVASVLRQRVLARRAPLLSDEAEAIATVSERISGRSNISTARRLSGRSIDRVVTRHRVSDETADMLVASIDQEVSRCTGIRRVLLLRDKVMFIAGRCMHLSTPQLLALDPSVFAAVNCDRFSFWGRVDTARRAAVMLSWYRLRLRPQLTQDAGDEALFIAQGGVALKPNAVGFRFTRAVQKAELSRLIPSWSDWIRSTHASTAGVQTVVGRAI